MSPFPPLLCPPPPATHTPTLDVTTVQNLKSHVCNELLLSSLVLCCLPAAPQALLVSELMSICPLIFALLYMHISLLPPFLPPSSLPFFSSSFLPCSSSPLPFLPTPWISSFCDSAGEEGEEITVWALPAILKLEVNVFSFVPHFQASAGAICFDQSVSLYTPIIPA